MTTLISDPPPWFRSINNKCSAIAPVFDFLNHASKANADWLLSAEGVSVIAREVIAPSVELTVNYGHGLIYYFFYLHIHGLATEPLWINPFRKIIYSDKPSQCASIRIHIKRGRDTRVSSNRAGECM